MSECKHDYVYNHEFRLNRCSKCLVVKKEVDWKDRAEKAEAENKSMMDFLTEVNLDWNYASWKQRKEKGDE